jgi:hypothetical protein
MNFYPLIVAFSRIPGVVSNKQGRSGRYTRTRAGHFGPAAFSAGYRAFTDELRG